MGTMTRTEFDQQVREMKKKHGNAIRKIATIQSEIKEEIAAKHRMIGEISKEINKLKQSLQGYYQKRLAMESDFRNEFNAFVREHEPSTTSNLAEATTLNIVYELRRRGFDGIITTKDLNPTEEGFEQYDLQKHDWNNGETSESA